jgi:hypothetical protein
MPLPPPMTSHAPPPAVPAAPGEPTLPMSCVAQPAGSDGGALWMSASRAHVGQSREELVSRERHQDHSGAA